MKEALPNAAFRVEIEPSKQIILASVSGKIRKHIVRVIVGDRVTLELSAYDLTKGRITFRHMPERKISASVIDDNVAVNVE